MEKYEAMFPDFSFAKHKGYCTKQHVEEIKLHGYSDIHRQSFRVKNLEEPELFETIEN